MEAKERLITVSYAPDQKLALEQFCDHCARHGYKNNASLDAMRLDWCLSVGGQFFLTLLDNKVISVSGCHPLMDNYRMLFRGATLPEYQNIFGVPSKTHMGSIPFFSHMPLQMEWATSRGYANCVVTTNWSNPDGITSMNHSHKVFKLLEKQGIVSCVYEKINLFNTDQSVWLVNKEKYNNARTGYKERNGLR